MLLSLVSIIFIHFFICTAALAQRERRAKEEALQGAKAAISSPILLREGSRARELIDSGELLDLTLSSPGRQPRAGRSRSAVANGSSPSSSALHGALPLTPALRPHRKAPLPPSAVRRIEVAPLESLTEIDSQLDEFGEEKRVAGRTTSSLSVQSAPGSIGPRELLLNTTPSLPAIDETITADMVV